MIVLITLGAIGALVLIGMAAFGAYTDDLDDDDWTH